MSWFLRAAVRRRDPRDRSLSRRYASTMLAVVALAPVAARPLRAQVVTTVALARMPEPPCAAIFADPTDSTPTRDSSADATPCTELPGPATVGHSRSRLPYIFYGGLAAGLVANRVAHMDSDPGGYRDTWGTETYFPDKGVHALSAFALTTVGVDLKLSPWKSAAAVCAAGALFETTQGYVSMHDIGADCIGAGLAGLWRHWRAR